MEGIQLKVENKNNISVIKVGGYIDTTTSSELEHHLTKLLGQNLFHIVIDLGNVDYVSSAGWGIFISEIKGIREKGGDLKLVGMIPEVYEVFELLEFHYILKAFDSLQDAIKDFEVSGMFSSPTAPPMPDTSAAPGSANMYEPVPVAPMTTTERVAESQTVQDMVKKIVKTMPHAGTGQIAKALRTPQYGNHKLGWFAMRRMLKDLGLDSKSKRMTFSSQS
jgi:anti-sigma B factor antagonist